MTGAPDPSLPSVGFFTQGTRTPSARFRVHQFLPHFARVGLPHALYAANPSNQGELSGFAPPPGLRRELLRLAAVPARLAQLGRHARAHDIVFVQKPLIFFPTSAPERWAAARRPVVFDVDDSVHLKHGRFGRERIRRVVASASHIIAGNEHLAEVMGAPDKTTIIPTVVDAERYTPRPTPTGRFTIGWTGISHNLRELEPFAEMLARVLRETDAQLLLVAERFDTPWLKRLPAERLVTVKWSPASETSALAQVHVGLMPLAKTDFNLGKCGFKLIQYMARGIPGIATPWGANTSIVRHGVDGYLADTVDAWEDALMTLGRDPALRERLGRAARERFESNYSIAAVLPRFLEVFRRVVA